MKDREELIKAIEQTDRLMSRVKQLEEKNDKLCKEKDDSFIRMRSVSPLGIFLYIILIYSFDWYLALPAPKNM